MSALRMLLLATALGCVLAPSALARGRKPGSVLVYPVQRSGPAFFTIVAVTNTNLAPAGPGTFGGSTELHYEYANSTLGADPFQPCNCTIFNRVEFLTPGDTRSVATSCHNATLPEGQEGYLVVSARDPSQFEVPWSFNYLMGSSLTINGGGGIYAMNAVPFKSPQTTFDPTDISPADGQIQFDDVEYQSIPDVLYVDSFVALAGSSLALVNLTGGPGAINTVQLTVWNDNEFALSSTRIFRCWFEQPLKAVSPLFGEAFLKNSTPDDPDEMYLGCSTDDPTLETGWAMIDSIDVKTSGGLPLSSDGALLGSITAGPGSFLDGGRLLWESVSYQTNGQSFAFGGGTGAPCAPTDQPPVCVVTDAGQGTIGPGEKFSATFTVSDPDDAQVTVELDQGPAGAFLNPPGGLVDVPFQAELCWTPDELDVGTHDFLVKVTDGNGGMSTCPFTVTVELFACVNEIPIDFNEEFLDGNVVPDGTGGSKLPAGTQVTTQYLADFDLVVSAISRSNEAWIFDSDNPTALAFDLGTPNEAFSGPGVGLGPNAGQNNDTALGKLLILQNPDFTVPNDDPFGGRIILELVNGTKAAVKELVIVDAEETPFLGEVNLYDENDQLINSPGDLLIPGIGDNSVQTVTNDTFPADLFDPETVRIEIEFFGSGALGELTLCIQ